MSSKETTAFRLNRALLEAMRSVKEDEGIPVTAQIEMAVRDWLTKRGTRIKSGRKITGRRKRA